jgi:hypothetical protein
MLRAPSMLCQSQSQSSTSSLRSTLHRKDDIPISKIISLTKRDSVDLVYDCDLQIGTPKNPRLVASSLRMLPFRVKLRLKMNDSGVIALEELTS